MTRHPHLGGNSVVTVRKDTGPMGSYEVVARTSQGKFHSPLKAHNRRQRHETLLTNDAPGSPRSVRHSILEAQREKGRVGRSWLEQGCCQSRKRRSRASSFACLASVDPLDGDVLGNPLYLLFRVWRNENDH